MALEKLLDTKKSVIKINNEDELCCAPAIVTMKAYCDFGSRHSEYDGLRRGRPVQARQAKELHRQAGVSEGPCGLSELEAFQRHLTSHQIMVLSVDHQYQIIFKGPPQDKHIVLIKVGEHYHGCNSLPGFLGTNQFSVECETSFNDDDYNHHPYKDRKCPACLQTGCQDYRPGESFDYLCRCCHRFFFGEQCLANHRTYSSINGKKADPAKKIKRVCGSTKKYPRCNRLLRPREIETRHICGTANVTRVKNTTISTPISVSSRTPPSWNKRENY